MNMRKPVNLHPAVNQNLFLAALPAETKALVLADLQQVSVKSGEILDQPDTEQSYIFFPTDTVISLQYVIECGKASEIMTISRDGIVGISNWLAIGGSYVQAVVQRAGNAYCIRGQSFKQKFDRDAALRSLTLRYLQSMISSTAQAAACNRHHTIDQQLCRKLLLLLDQTVGMELRLTHEAIAQALGVRREGVTQAAARLRDLGVIDYRRGRIEVLDRQLLEQLSCECYQAIKTQNARLLPYLNSGLAGKANKTRYGSVLPRAHAY
ncbi:Crp/Fnr family transcriptional regulator [Kineobactrum salinum]|uniref:Crp/Fnr family transcriptional regulator n=1 Tax=Kineobactrum salinum TaxID=2708301 RepID=A0A6C0UB57_9GAMM|nr:Crp/Fnr family transcriptional regulator [Kineobactrum salinum]QIB67224.1 Crp/Fnr family transcriptional regulator [Kineobactrum salinum]